MKLEHAPRLTFEPIATKKHTKSQSSIVYTPGPATWHDIVIIPEENDVITVGDIHSNIVLELLGKFSKFEFTDVHIHTKRADGNFEASFTTATYV